MEDISYLHVPYFSVSQQEKLAFFKKLPKVESAKVKTLYNTIKAVFVVSDKYVFIENSEDRVYKMTIVDELNNTLGTLYYMPLLSRLDIYNSETPGIPLIQVKKKQIIYYSYSWILNKLGVDKLFSRLINVI